MTTYIAYVFDKDAAQAVDDSTIIVKVKGGTCTLRFVNKEHMKKMALTILDAVNKPEDEALEPVNLLDAIERFDVTDEEGEEAKVDEETANEESEAESESVAESIDAPPDTPDPRNNDNNTSGSESSFEDYAGMGLTQELNF